MADGSLRLGAADEYLTLPRRKAMEPRGPRGTDACALGEDIWNPDPSHDCHVGFKEPSDLPRQVSAKPITIEVAHQDREVALGTENSLPRTGTLIDGLEKLWNIDNVREVRSLTGVTDRAAIGRIEDDEIEALCGKVGRDGPGIRAADERTRRREVERDASATKSVTGVVDGATSCHRVGHEAPWWGEVVNEIGEDLRGVCPATFARSGRDARTEAHFGVAEGPEIKHPEPPAVRVERGVDIRRSVGPRVQECLVQGPLSGVQAIKHVVWQVCGLVQVVDEDEPPQGLPLQAEFCRDFCECASGSTDAAGWTAARPPFRGTALRVREQNHGLLVDLRPCLSALAVERDESGSGGRAVVDSRRDGLPAEGFRGSDAAMAGDDDARR